MRGWLKPWEIVLILVGMFFVCSTSLYWYNRYTKTWHHAVEYENRMQWEMNTRKWQEDTVKWQKDATDNINGLRQSQQQVLDILNANFVAGRLIPPEKKK